MTRGKLVLSARSAHLAARVSRTGDDEREQDPGPAILAPRPITSRVVKLFVS